MGCCTASTSASSGETATVPPVAVHALGVLAHRFRPAGDDPLVELVQEQLRHCMRQGAFGARDAAALRSRTSAKWPAARACPRRPCGIMRSAASHLGRQAGLTPRLRSRRAGAPRVHRAGCAEVAACGRREPRCRAGVAARPPPPAAPAAPTRAPVQQRHRRRRARGARRRRSRRRRGRIHGRESCTRGSAEIRSPASSSLSIHSAARTTS
jgi:hypothetical protein